MCSDCNEELKTMNSLGVYRRHIKKFAQTAKPIYDLLSLDLWKKKNVTSTKHSPRGNSGQISSSSPVEWETQHQSALEVLIDHITSPPVLAYPDCDAAFIVHTDASQDGLGAVLYQEQNGSTRVIAYASRTLTPSERNYHMHSGKLEFLSLKWAVTEQFRDYLYYAPEFVVYTDNNPLTYVLTSDKLNATWLSGLESSRTSTLKYGNDQASWTLMLTVFPGYLLTSRTTWIVVLRIVPESLQASICGIQTLSSGDSTWLMALTDDDGELHQVDIPSQAGCNQVKVVDIVRAQKEEPHIGRVLKVIKANQKPTVGQKQKESPLVRKLLNEWHKLHEDKKSSILHRNQKIVLPHRIPWTPWRNRSSWCREGACVGSWEILLALHEQGYKQLYPSYMPLSETETPKSTNKRAITANCHNSSSSNTLHWLCTPRTEFRGPQVHSGCGRSLY